MIISEELAQRIVDHLMDTVERNVNIMDCNGIIIASGKKERISTFHQGGKRAVDEQTVVEIYPEEITHYVGALAGVMWPIELKKKIVGVVGVTGEPHEVRNTAKLVKTVTELILEREMSLADERSESWIKEQLLTLLFSDKPEAVMDDIVTLAAMLDYTLNLPRVVILAKFTPKQNDSFCDMGLQNLLSARIRENVLHAMNSVTFLTSEDIGLFFKKNLCIIKHIPDMITAKKFSVFTNSLVTVLHSIQPQLQIQVGIGSRALNESQLRQSYCEALFALEYPNTNTIRSIAEFDVLLDYLFSKRAACYDSCLALQALREKFNTTKGRYDMEKTLQCLLANNLSVSLSAKQLFLHRNTLKFRLDKLKKTVGLEPCHSFQHAMLCKIILSTQNSG